MKLFNRIIALVIVFSLACIASSAQKATPKIREQKTRQVWLRLKAGPILNGDLVKMDADTVDFTVKGILQSVSCDDLIGVMFIPPSPRPTPTPIPTPSPTPTPIPTPVPIFAVYPMSAGLSPKILYRESAAYTPKAKAEKIQGTVVLLAVFHETGMITNINVIRPLPHGLTEQAIDAARKIRFIPAMKDGKLVSVRGQLEFTFNLY